MNITINLDDALIPGVESAMEKYNAQLPDAAPPLTLTGYIQFAITSAAESWTRDYCGDALREEIGNFLAAEKTKAANIKDAKEKAARMKQLEAAESKFVDDAPAEAAAEPEVVKE